MRTSLPVALLVGSAVSVLGATSEDASFGYAEYTKAWASYTSALLVSATDDTSSDLACKTAVASVLTDMPTAPEVIYTAVLAPTASIDSCDPGAFFTGDVSSAYTSYMTAYRSWYSEHSSEIASLETTCQYLFAYNYDSVCSQTATTSATITSGPAAATATVTTATSSGSGTTRTTLSTGTTSASGTTATSTSSASSASSSTTTSAAAAAAARSLQGMTLWAGVVAMAGLAVLAL